MGCDFSSTLRGEGTFYVKFSHKDGDIRKYKISFHNKDDELTTSTGTIGVYSPIMSVVALDVSTLLVTTTGDNCFIFTTTDKWDSAALKVFKSKSESRGVLLYLADKLSYAREQTVLEGKGLTLLRSDTDTDFTIVCKYDEKIAVHSLVLKRHWPFFAAMMDSHMAESAEKTMSIPYPKSWVEAMVSYFYAESRELSFEDSTGLLIIAQMYDVPELLAQAMRRITYEEMNIGQGLAAWRSAFEAKNEDVQMYCAEVIHEGLENLPHSRELLTELAQEELVQLFMDIANTKSPVKKLKT